MADHTAPDPTVHSRWRPLRLLLAAMDADIARVYAHAGIQGLKPSFAMELIRLHARGPMTITELAASVQRTHSAMSQKVAAMRAAGLVRTTTGADARSRVVMLTARAERMAGRLAAEWRATEAALEELEAEIPYPLSRAVTDITEALGRRSFYDRVTGKLATDPAWQQGLPTRGGQAVRLPSGRSAGPPAPRAEKGRPAMTSGTYAPAAHHRGGRCCGHDAGRCPQRRGRGAVPGAGQ